MDIYDIDFEQLREQKQSLLFAIDLVDDGEDKENLVGLLHLIDSIQDSAVDEYDMDEEAVFGFNEED